MSTEQLFRYITRDERSEIGRMLTRFRSIKARALLRLTFDAADVEPVFLPPRSSLHPQIVGTATILADTESTRG
jgi:hypothetical protein